MRYLGCKKAFHQSKGDVVHVVLPHLGRNLKQDPAFHPHKGDVVHVVLSHLCRNLKKVLPQLLLWFLSHLCRILKKVLLVGYQQHQKGVG